MSAHDQMRAMLDQLMGTGRNGEGNKFNVRFDDPKVCKSFLLNCCPHDILSSTRMDLGECPKIHDMALRADFSNASVKKDYFYDIDAAEHLQSFIAGRDRRTEEAKKKLKETQEELSAEVSEKLNAIHELNEAIGEKLARAEQLGAEGQVDESIKLMDEIEEIRKKKRIAEETYRNSMPSNNYQQQKLRVCEVCSAYLGIHDNDQRLADHFGGKLHLGFIQIREKLAELEAKLEARKEERREYDKKQRSARDADRERDRNRSDRNRHGDKNGRHDRDRDRGKRDREERTDRDRDDRGGDRHRRDRDRHRSRSKSPNRRSRSHKPGSGDERSPSRSSYDHRKRSQRSSSRDRKRDRHN